MGYQFNRLQGLFGIGIRGGFKSAATVLILMQVGCMSPSQHRQKADQTAQEIIAQKHQEALGREGSVNIERPSTILRRRLLDEQELAVSGPASLGTDQLETIEHWPDKDYPPSDGESEDAFVQMTKGKPIKLSLVDALQVGARNSSDYQREKENVFSSALSLDLKRNEFRTIFQAQASSRISGDTTGDHPQTGTVQTGSLSASQKFYNGTEVSSNFFVDVANLLTGGGASSLVLAGDTTVSMPLLRGSGRHIVTEPLTQAERNVVYELWDFEQYKKTFAVNVASSYFNVLRNLDDVANSRENYRSVIASARRSRRQADAGRIQEIEVDQASQNELSARQRWIGVIESYQNSLDSFKSLIGLPTDAQIELDPNDLVFLVSPTQTIRESLLKEDQEKAKLATPPADAPIILEEPTREDAGPWELEEETAVRMALEHRLDFLKLHGQVYDAQRAVVVYADWLGAELTLGGSAAFGSRRSSAGSAASDDAQFRLDEGTFSGLLTLDLPLERTAARIDYRNSLISLERAVRSVQDEEDQIKLSVRRTLRTMRQARENLYIQTKAVMIAEKRVRSVTLFMEAGRAAMRDLLEAQEDLLTAQNGLTSAAVSYRVAELELQRDMGLLNINEKGLWRELSPEELKND